VIAGGLSEFNDYPKEQNMTAGDWKILVLSALPLTELRATIPLALDGGIPPLRAFFLAVLGNLIPVVPILVLLEPVSLLIRRFPFVDRIFQSILVRTRQREGQVKKYGLLGLIIFVAVPLPGTGAWTGALLAWLFGLNPVLATAAISLGVILAGAAVTLASIGIIQLAPDYGIKVLLLVIVLAIGGYLFRRKKE
jgi:uncharacterized membrane protein